MRKAWLAGLAAMLAPAVALAAPAAGRYENGLMLGVAPNGVVTGYFQMSQDGPPQITCAFYLKGKLNGDSARIDTYYPDDPKGDLIKGTLSAPDRTVTTITLPTDHGGCGNVWSFADKDNPASFDLNGPANWIAVRVVKARRAYLYKAAGAAGHGAAYVVQGDGVGVLGVQGAWVWIEFEGPSKVTLGWVKASDLYPA